MLVEVTLKTRIVAVDAVKKPILTTVSTQQPQVLTDIQEIYIQGSSHEFESGGGARLKCQGPRLLTLFLQL